MYYLIDGGECWPIQKMGSKGMSVKKNFPFFLLFFPFLVSREFLRFTFKFTHGVVFVFGKVRQVPRIKTISVHITALLMDVSLPGEVVVGGLGLGFSLG